MANFRAIKNFQRVLNDYNTPKNAFLNQATQKITCQKFPTPKIPKSKISNAPKSFDHPCHLKSGVPPPPIWADHSLGLKAEKVKGRWYLLF